MSASQQCSAPARPRRRRRLWRILLAVFVLLVLVGVPLVLGLRAYYFHRADERVRQAKAMLDDEDPRWRWEDILADRAQVPEDENSARPILAAGQIIPKDWPKRRAVARKQVEGFAGPVETRHLGERVTDTPPNHRLNEDLAAELRAELQALAPALAAAQRVPQLSQGRYEISWSRDYVGTNVDHVQRARAVAQLFALHAALQAAEGNQTQALTSIRGALNTGRSLGDEPLLISQLVRIACGMMAVRSLERVLAQGEASLPELEDMQMQLYQEAAGTKGLLRYSLRAERAAFFDLTGRFASGEFGWRYLSTMLDRMSERSGSGSEEETWWSSCPSWLILRPLARYNQAAILELMTELVEIAELPPSEQSEAFAEFHARSKTMKENSPQLLLAMLFLPAADKVASALHRYRASLDCAQAALAAERFRRDQGRWPDSLAALVPKYLNDVPEDPFDGRPLRYRRTPDGVKVFSVGPDGSGDQVVLDPGSGKPRPVVGFQLWDVKQRRNQAADGT